jgi:hypothetical protein
MTGFSEGLLSPVLPRNKYNPLYFGWSVRHLTEDVGDIPCKCYPATASRLAMTSCGEDWSDWEPYPT